MVRAGTDLSVIADMVSERDAMALLDSIFESLVDSKLPFSCTHGVRPFVKSLSSAFITDDC